MRPIFRLMYLPCEIRKIIIKYCDRKTYQNLVESSKYFYLLDDLVYRTKVIKEDKIYKIKFYPYRSLKVLDIKITELVIEINSVIEFSIDVYHDHSRLPFSPIFVKEIENIVNPTFKMSIHLNLLFHQPFSYSIPYGKRYVSYLSYSPY